MKCGPEGRWNYLQCEERAYVRIRVGIISYGTMADKSLRAVYRGI